MMNHPPPASNIPPSVPPPQNRRLHEYHYPSPTSHPPAYHVPYANYHHQPQYGPPQLHHYPQQWYQPYQQYLPPTSRQYQQQSPLVVSSYPHTQPIVPLSRQPLQIPQPMRTPQPEQLRSPPTPQLAISPAVTAVPTSSSTSTPPAAIRKASVTATAISPRMPFYPQLPWFSAPESTFPLRTSKGRRKRKAAQLPSDGPELPSRKQPQDSGECEDQTESQTSTITAATDGETPLTSLASSEVDIPSITSQPSSFQTLSHSAPLSNTGEGDRAIEEFKPEDETGKLQVPIIESPSNTSAQALPTSASVATASAVRAPTVTQQPATIHKKPVNIPIVPLVPIRPIVPSSNPPSCGQQGDATTTVNSNATAKGLVSNAETTTAGVQTKSETAPTMSPEPPRAPPKSWAELLRNKTSTVNGAEAPLTANGGIVSNGTLSPKGGSLADALRLYSVESGGKICFLEPRGLVNTGNMCYMNSILQVLVFCVPLYDFLDEVGKRAVHNFKSDTPLIDAMITFMREYPIIDSASSVQQLRLRLKDNELEQYGEAFIPEYVYEVIKRLPRFSTMRRGHQQDAEEFLGFLLEGLHDECVHVMQKLSPDSTISDSFTSPTSEHSTELSSSANSGWLEVGPKQKASITRSSGAIGTESPITKIFGGKLRSVLRVAGLKDSITLEPYQPLQLDIGGSNVFNITDALKGLTRSETLHGDFNSPRGPSTSVTKQVFIETLPPVLILHLKRFQYDNAGGTQKIWKKIGYPLELEIPKEVFPPHKRGGYATRPRGLPKYRLIAVVYHHGKNASGGHYTVDVRRQEKREWIRMDDTVIRRVRAEEVAGESGEEDPKVLAAALEAHQRGQNTGKSLYNYAGLEEDEDVKDDDQGGWSQVNGNSTSPSTTGNQKKLSALVNGVGTTTPSTAGKRTPKENGKYSLKDNKVAYILFYQEMT